MERSGRRNRRRCPVFQPPQQARFSGFFGFLQTLVVMGTIVAIMYILMEYHCKTCNSKCEINKLSKNIDQLADNLNRIHGFYVELERKVSKFSQDLPKIEGQIDILESLAKRLVTRRHEWNPKNRLTLPMSNVFLTPPVHKCHSLPQKNCTKISLPCRKASQVQ